MTTLIHDPGELRRQCERIQRTGQRLGLVPTMGALHTGHLSLVEAVRAAGADQVVVTIFVNPLQFGENEDLARYPRTLEADLDLLRPLGTEWVFAPTHEAMYPPGFQTHVEVTGVTATLEGTSRPHHFRGVTTVVNKLFNLAGPCIAAFGRKDYQQLCTIQQMVRDLAQPVEVLPCPIVREADGLALSSRNRYLTADERRRATGLVKGLRAAADRFNGGERSVTILQQAAAEHVTQAADRVDYVTLVDPQTLEPPGEACGDRVALLLAAWVGNTRLIDNAVLGQDVLPAG